MKKLFFVMVFVSQTDEHGTEHRKDVGLYEGHQHFEQIHEQQHDDAESIQSQSEADAHCPAEEDNARET